MIRNLLKTKTKKRTTKRKWFTGIEILLVLLLLGGGASGVSNYKQKRKLNAMTEQNTEQAVVINNLVKDVDKINNEKDKTVEKLQEVEKQLKSKASTGFSILYEQAVDINKEASSTYTKAHEQTAKKYVEVWGYDAMARLIKWQQDQIEKQLKETKTLMLEKQKLNTEYLEYKVKTQELIGQTSVEAEKHKNAAVNLQDKVKEHLSKNSWLSNILWYLAFGTGAYLFITVGGLPLLLSFKNKAVNKIKEELHVEKKKKSKALKGIKSFRAADEHGNETMERIIQALGIDVDGDDDD